MYHNLGGLGTQQLGIFSLLPSWIKGLFLLIILVFIGVYIYLAVAYMKIGKKAGISCPGVAWISPIISIFEISKMHWWPWPVTFIGFLLLSLLQFVNPSMVMVIYVLLILLILIMIITWQWKTFGAVNKPGWWALITPSLFSIGLIFISLKNMLVAASLFLIGILIYLILVGLAAWGKK